MLTNRQFAFARKCQDSAVITALNNDEQPASFELPLMYSNASVQILAGPEEGAQVKVQDGKVKIQLPADRGVILHVKA